MNSNDAERATLGAILLSGQRNLDSLGLAADDFYQPKHASVFGASERVVRAGNRPDLVSVRMAIGAKSPAFGPNDVGIFLAELTESCPVAGQLEFYAAAVGAASDRRGLWAITDRVRQMIEEGLETEDITDRMSKMLDQAPRRGGATSKSWAEINPRVVDHLERGVRRGLPTPWSDLNRHLTGLVGSRVYTVAARPGEGKSLVGQALAVHVAKNLGKPVLFASLEMSELDLGTRIYSDQASVPMSVLESRSAGPSHWDSIAQATRAMANMGLHINDQPEQSIAQIRSEARSIKDLGLVIVDYLQLVKPANPRADRREQVDQISRDLKLMAKDLDVPVVSLAQLNRNNQQRADKTPGLSDLRESGSIEQDSDIVILMQLTPETGELTAHIGKNRYGSKAPVALELWGHYARIIQAERQSA